jgi:uncharacterized protein (TIRG00374 family)
MTARIRFALLLVAFVTLTGLGVWWAAPPREVLERSWEELARLGAWNVLVLFGLAFVVIVSEMVRLVVFGRALGVPVPWRAAFDASVANDLFSWITPGALLGEPATVVVLTRRGVPLDGAIAIMFGKFATSFIVIMGSASVLLALGYGPEIPGWALLSIAATLGLGVIVIGGFVVGAWFPAPMLRRLERLERWLMRKPRGAFTTRAITGSCRATRNSIERLARFRGTSWLPLFASHLFYYGSYVAVLVVLAAMFGATSLWTVTAIAVVYHAFTYIAPAPGLPEAGAAAFFGGVLSDGSAFVVVLLFRALTAYFQILLGLVYLPAVGMLRAILAKQPASHPPPPAP